MSRFNTVANHLRPKKFSEAFDIEYPEKALDENMTISIKFRADSCPTKVNCNYTYKDENGKMYFLFRAVKKAEKMLLDNLNYEPLGPEGLPEFNDAVSRLVFSHNIDSVEKGNAVSCSEALRLALDFVKKVIPGKVYIPEPSYGNHCPTLEAVGLEYAHFNYVKKSLDEVDWESICKTLLAAEPGSLFLLQPCCHNPNGVDPSLEQWKKIATIMKQMHWIQNPDYGRKKSLTPIWDLSFLGMRSGDPKDDALVFKVFMDLGVKMVVSISFSKIMGLYGDRVGAVLTNAENNQEAKILQNHLNQVIELFHGHSPIMGGRLVATVLTTPELNKEWRVN